MEQNGHSEYPFLSIVFTLISWFSYHLGTYDMAAFDKNILLPIVHFVTIGSGSTAIVLGCIAFWDRVVKGKRKK